MSAKRDLFCSDLISFFIFLQTLYRPDRLLSREDRQYHSGNYSRGQLPAPHTDHSGIAAVLSPLRAD